MNERQQARRTGKCDGIRQVQSCDEFMISAWRLGDVCLSPRTAAQTGKLNLKPANHPKKSAADGNGRWQKMAYCILYGILTVYCL